MFKQSAPWLKESPRYTPLEHACGQAECHDGRPSALRSANAGKHCRSARNANYQFIITNAANIEEDAPSRRLGKNDFRRLRRYQNHRMRMSSALRVVAITMLMVWWLVPIYLVSHAAGVWAIAHKCGSVLQSALANSAIKTWLKVYAA